ncbi:hypothetical protein [Neptunicoccus sediminis]|uniref:hypothetical protein n=1 Tax=Neptunicoccus sediminis TaxID=1892596 RepID=UPI000845F305|nr:hypothetical protein [Neptunicoccus sediminis]
MTVILRILIAPLVWLVCFSAVYGLHALACDSAFGAFAGSSTARIVLLVAFVLALALQLAIFWYLHRPNQAAPAGFLRFVTRASAWTGLVATIWTLFPVVALSTCT